MNPHLQNILHNITTRLAALEEALSKQEQGCEFCNHPLYVGTKCKNCGEEKQEQGEPEMVRNMRLWVTALKSVSDNGQHMKIPSGLSSGTCWELAVALEKFIDTTQQQRTWIGLTDKQKQSAVWSDGSFGSGALWAEEQLKRNNT